MGRSTRKSDVDLVVDLKARDPPKNFRELMLDLWDKLEAFFGRRVDLLTMRSVKNPVMREGDRTDQGAGVRWKPSASTGLISSSLWMRSTSICEASRPTSNMLPPLP
ncbi:MAG: nucleotidyltransferase domain-containing protein [Flavobacteriales bacterium]|nr:nucleotidyltransferase domain-containing protein [Flavobacteriales bacterium]